jgi:peptidoglycan/LPS O-acetylase OafA/YrhL
VRTRPGGLAARLEAATPPDRDRSIDALRAFAILGVVLGHWLVTALAASGDGRLTVASPLRSMPWFRCHGSSSRWRSSSWPAVTRRRRATGPASQLIFGRFEHSR